MNEKIFSKIKTEEQRQMLKAEIELLMNALYSGGEELEHVLKVEVRSWVSEVFRGVFNTASVNKEQYLKDLLLDIDKFKSVSLILAFEPSEDTLDRFHSYIQDMVGKRVLVDMVYEPQIIGGAVIM